MDINQRMSTLANRPPPLIPHGIFFFPVKKNVKGHHIFSLMLHNRRRWAFPCPADEVGSEALKPFEGLCTELCSCAGKTCLGLPTGSLQQTRWGSYMWLHPSQAASHIMNSTLGPITKVCNENVCKMCQSSTQKNAYACVCVCFFKYSYHLSLLKAPDIKQDRDGLICFGVRL